MKHDPTTIIRTLICLLLMLPLGASAAEAFVHDVGAAGNVILEYDHPPNHRRNDEIELTYRAGLMDMLLGRYRVEALHGNRIEVRPISVSAPPSQGMRVMVTPVGAMPPMMDAPTPASIGHRVAEVRGKDIEIDLDADSQVAVGDRFSLAFDAPRVGRVPIQGTWHVTKIIGKRALAEPEGMAGQPRVGQIATLLASDPVTTPLPADAKGAGSGGLFGSVAEPGMLDFDAWFARQGQGQGQGSSTAGGTPLPARDGNASTRGWIGVALQELTPELAESLGLAPNSGGILIADVVPAGPADAAGLRRGDVVLEVNEASLDIPQLVDLVGRSGIGDLLRLRVWRAKSPFYAAVRIGKAK